MKSAREQVIATWRANNETTSRLGKQDASACDIIFSTKTSCSPASGCGRQWYLFTPLVLMVILTHACKYWLVRHQRDEKTMQRYYHWCILTTKFADNRLKRRDFLAQRHSQRDSSEEARPLSSTLSMALPALTYHLLLPSWPDQLRSEAIALAGSQDSAFSASAEPFRQGKKVRWGRYFDKLFYMWSKQPSPLRGVPLPARIHLWISWDPVFVPP